MLLIGGMGVEQLDDLFAAAEVTLDDSTLAAIDVVSQEFMYPMG